MFFSCCKSIFRSLNSVSFLCRSNLMCSIVKYYPFITSNKSPLLDDQPNTDRSASMEPSTVGGKPHRSTMASDLAVDQRSRSLSVDSNGTIDAAISEQADQFNAASYYASGGSADGTANATDFRRKAVNRTNGEHIKHIGGKNLRTNDSVEFCTYINIYIY